MNTKKMGWAGRLLLLVILATLAAIVGDKAYALTAAQVVTSNFSAASTGTVILLHDGETLTYKDIGSTNVGTVQLEKSFDGQNWDSLSVGISTKNNSGTFTGSLIVQARTQGGLVRYRWNQAIYTSGTSSTTMTEGDFLSGQDLNVNGESTRDSMLGGQAFNGYLKVLSSALSVSSSSTAGFRLNFLGSLAAKPATTTEGDFYWDTVQHTIAIATATKSDNSAWLKANTATTGAAWTLY